MNEPTPREQAIDARDNEYAEAVNRDFDAKQAAAEQAKQPKSFMQEYGDTLKKWSLNGLDAAISSLEMLGGHPELVPAGAGNAPITRIARSAAAGTVEAGVQLADTAHSALVQSGRGLAMAEDPAHAQEAAAAPDISHPAWDYAKKAALNFRDMVAVRDPSLAEGAVQSGAQFMVPFLGYAKALGAFGNAVRLAVGGSEEAGLLTKLVGGAAKTIGGNAATDASAMDPHMMRLSDIYALGRAGEGKLADILRQVPGGIDAYLQHLADHKNEGEAEGRWKNVVDGMLAGGPFAVLSELVTAGGHLFKQGQPVLRAAQANGVGAMADLQPTQQAVAAVDASRAAARTPEQDISAKARAVAAKVRELQAKYPDVDNPEYQKAVGPLHDQLIKYNEQLVSAQTGLKPPAAPTPAPEPVAMASSKKDAAKSVQNFLKQEPWEPVWGHPDYPTNLDTAAAPGLIGDKGMGRFVTMLKNLHGDAEGVPSASVLSALQMRLPNNADGDFYRELTSRLIDHPDVTQSTVKVMDQNHPEMRYGEYDPTPREVRLFPSTFGDPSVVTHSLTHELAHAATWHTIDSHPVVQSELEQLIRAMKASPALEGIPHESIYGLTDAHEVTAEAESNPGFIQIMHHVELPATKTRPAETAYERYKHIIGGILGLSAAAIASPAFDKFLTPQGPAAKEKPGA